jgi:hypothetical protein
MGYVTSVVMVAFYFEKKRALTTGLSVCGSSAGVNSNGRNNAPQTTKFNVTPLSIIKDPLHVYSSIKYSNNGANKKVPIPEPHTDSPVVWKRNLEAFEKISRTVSKASLHDHGRHSQKCSESESSEENSNGEEICGAEQLSHSQVILPTFLNEKKKDTVLDIFSNASRFLFHSSAGVNSNGRNNAPQTTKFNVTPLSIIKDPLHVYSSIKYSNNGANKKVPIPEPHTDSPVVRALFFSK